MALSHWFHVIPQAQQIGQLLLLPYHATNHYSPVTRGEQGFGSTGDQLVCFTQQILSDWPTCKAKIQGKMFSELLDPGADISIITSPQRPADWPLTEPQEKIIRLGGTSTICSKCNSSSLPRAQQTTCSLPTFLLQTFPVLLGTEICLSIGT